MHPVLRGRRRSLTGEFRGRAVHPDCRDGVCRRLGSGYTGGQAFIAGAVFNVARNATAVLGRDAPVKHRKVPAHRC